MGFFRSSVASRSLSCEAVAGALRVRLGGACANPYMDVIAVRESDKNALWVSAMGDGLAVRGMRKFIQAKYRAWRSL